MKIKRALAAVCVLAVILSAAAGGVTTTRAETVQSEQNSALEMQNVHEDQIKEHGFVKDCIVWDITELDKEENDRIVYGYTVRASKDGEVVASATYYDSFVEYRRFFYENDLDFGEYAFEICSFDRNGNSGEFSQPIPVEYEPTLDAPSNVRLSEGQNILWDCVEGAERYNFRFKKGSELCAKDYYVAGTDSFDSFSIWIGSWLGSSGDYTFEVQAMDKNYNVSAWSEPVSVTYTEPDYVESDLPRLEAPENVRLDESGNNILWDAVEGADSYVIEVSCTTNAYYYANYGYVYDGKTQYDNWKLLTCPFYGGKYEIQVHASGDGFKDSWSEILEADFTPILDESIELPEKVWTEGGVLYWGEWEDGVPDKEYWASFSLYSADGELIYGIKEYAYIGYCLEIGILPAGTYELEIFVVDVNGNYNSKKYPVEINTVPDESVWVPRLHYKGGEFLWDWDLLRYGNTNYFWVRLKKKDGTVASLWRKWYNSHWLEELENGEYRLEVCAAEDGDKIGNWTGISFEEYDGSRFDEENESASDVVQAPEASEIPEDDRIISISMNPAFNMKDKWHGNEFDLSQIRIKAKEIYDEEGLKRAEEALGKEIVGNKHYNLLDLTLWEGDRDISNGYEGLVKVIIPLPKGHRDKTFSCYRLTEVGGQMIKEVIEGEQTEDSYIIYLEHFSQYALVADGGEEDAKGDGEWEYELLEDGTAEITAYKGNESELEIPESIDGVSVTRIKDHVFSGYSGLTSVTIPDSVTSIGDGAFEKCGGLTSVTIPDSVTSIGVFAFSFCGGLTSVTIPDSMTSIGNGLFYDCGSLTSVTIPDSVTSIGDYAFERCGGLTSVAIPDSVTSIGICAFCHCGSLTSVTIPKGVTSIGANAFYECGLTSVTIPDSVTSIDVRAFGYMQEGSNYVKIPDFTVCGRPDTAAEAYAKENNFIFTEIKEESGEAPIEKPSDDMDYSDVASGSGIPGTFIAVFLLAGLAVIAAGAVVAAKAFKASAESRG